MFDVHKKRPPRHKAGERFVKGPIPWEWIAEASRLGGSALKVGIALWFYAGMKNSRSIKLSNRILSEINLNRSTKYRGLQKLESRELISIHQTSGNSPVITLLDFPIPNTHVESEISTIPLIKVRRTHAES